MLPVWEHGDPRSVCKDPITDTFGGGLFSGPCNGCRVLLCRGSGWSTLSSWERPPGLDFICALGPDLCRSTDKPELQHGAALGDISWSVCSLRWFGKLSPFAKGVGVSGCPVLALQSPQSGGVLPSTPCALWRCWERFRQVWLSLNCCQVPVGTVQPPVSGSPAVSARREAPGLAGTGLWGCWSCGHRDTVSNSS